MPGSRRFVGIDPGYERMGVAVVERPEKGREVLIHSDCIRTSAQEPHARRLFSIREAFESCLRAHSPSVLAIETLFFNSNQKTALAVSEARGVILAEAAGRGLEIREFSPLQIKQAITGYGRSEKRQIIALLPQLISIDKPIRYDDEYDAIAVALTASASFDNPRYAQLHT